MADETVVGAGTTTTAETPASVAPATATEKPVERDWDKILDSPTEEVKETPVDTQETEAAKTSKEEPVAKPEDKAAEEESLDDPLGIFKAINKLPGVSQELKSKVQSLAGRVEAFSEIGTVGEFAKLKADFPTEEAVNSALESVAELTRIDSQMLTTDPAKHIEGLSQYAKDYPAEFETFVSNIPEAIFKIDPKLAQSTFNRVNQAYLADWHAQATRQGMTDLAEALSTVHEAIYGGEIGAKRASDPENDKLKNRIQEMEKAASTQKQAARESFYENTVTPAAGQKMNSVLDGLMKPVFEKYEPDPMIKDRVRNEIIAKVAPTVLADKEWALSFKQRLNSGNMDQAHANELVTMFVNKGRALLPAIVQEVLNEWTPYLVKTSQTSLQRDKQRAERADIGPNSKTTGTKKPALTKEQAAKMTDDEILNY